MESEPTNLNWRAIIVGKIAAYVLGMLWFGLRILGKDWSTGQRVLVISVVSASTKMTHNRVKNPMLLCYG